MTDQSRHKLQSTENFIDAIKTAQIPDDHRLVSFDVKSLFTSIPLQLALDCHYDLYCQTTATYRRHHKPNMYLTSALRLLTFSTMANTTNSYTEQLWAHQFPLLLQKLLCNLTSRNKPFRPTLRHYHYGYDTLTIPLPPYTKTRSTPFTNISTDRTLTYSLLRRSRKMVKFLF